MSVAKEMARKMRPLLVCLLFTLILSGCGVPAERFGRTWYIDGAGNWGFGIVDVPIGLKEAGYQGHVSNYRWSLTLNPALDQTLRFIAKGSSALLAAEIDDFLNRYPEGDANIIALSAGSGVGIWAVESVKPPHKVSNVVLVGSSLSSRYDVTRALKNMKGNIYCYHTSSDPVLQGPVRLLGTIDGSFDDSAGLVGLRGPGAAGGRVVNIGWNSRFSALGWTGGHADCTNRRFVKGEIAKRILPGASRGGVSTQQHAEGPAGSSSPPVAASASGR